MTNTYAIKQDILSLRGANVRIFGQPVTLPNTVNEFTIDILDILDALSPYEFDLDILGLDTTDDDAIYDRLRELGYIYDECDYRGDNSYNWCAPVSNEFDFKIYDNALTDGIIVEFKVHRYGDVRCNYTDAVLYMFDDFYAFYDAVSAANKFIRIDVNNICYGLDISVFADTFEVCNADTGAYVCEAFGSSLEEVTQNIIDKLHGEV